MSETEFASATCQAPCACLQKARGRAEKNNQRKRLTFQADNTCNGPKDRKQAQQALLKVGRRNVRVEVVYKDVTRGPLRKLARRV